MKLFRIVIAIYLLVLIKSLFSIQFGFGLLDEGEYNHIGLRILRGDLPYKDFFSYLPPLYSYWNALAFKIFGVSAYSIKLLNSLVFSLVPVLFFLIAQRFTSKKYAVVSAVVIAFMELNTEKLYYHFFTFSALLLFFIFLSKKKLLIGFTSGFLFGIAGLFRLDIGFQFFAGCILGAIIYFYIVSKTWLKDIISYLPSAIIGFLIPLFILVYWLVSHDIWWQFLQNVLLSPGSMTSTYRLAFPLPWEIFPESFAPKDLFSAYEALFAYFIIVVYLSFSFYLIKNWKITWQKNTEVPILFIIGLFTAPYMFGRTDLGHLIKGGIPMFLIMGFLLDKYEWIGKKLKISLLLAPGILILVGVGQIYWWSTFFDTRVYTQNGDILINSSWPKGTVIASANSIDRAVNFIEKNTADDQQVLILPYMAGLYFLSNRPSKAYVGNMFYTYLPSEEYFLDRVNDLEIEAVVYDPENGPQGELKRLKDYYPKIDEYIIENYRVVERTEEGWLFMLKKQ